MEIYINPEKSDFLRVRGVVYLGIDIPFTAYRYSEFPTINLEQFNVNMLRRVVVRSKSGILRKFKDRERIKAKIRNAAKGWWIDNGHWRVHG